MEMKKKMQLDKLRYPPDRDRENRETEREDDTKEERNGEKERQTERKKS